MDRIIAIGDIHGCFYTLLNLINKLNYNEKTDTLIFLGDYIDRGKNSFEVVSYLINLQKEVGKDKCICLMGNHEYMALKSIEDKEIYECSEIEPYNVRMWYSNGGQKTRKSYYRNNSNVKIHKNWFSKLPLFYTNDNYIFCHAGLTHPKLKDNDLNDLIWGREWIECKTTPNEKQVIFGHTPWNAPYVYKTNDGSICLDSGCVFGGNLCAMIIKDDKFDIVYCAKSELD